MFSDIRRIGLLVGSLVLATVSCATFPTTLAARETVRIDDDWRFHLGDENSAAEAEFDDAAWRTVNLPHDWSIEGATDKAAPSGRDGGYFPTGIGWYRHTFTPDEKWRNLRVELEFEGVYHDTSVWINGQRLGFHAYGYTPFIFDLTPHLKFGQPNVIAVRVDNSQQPNTRWYSGSGIYRHVWLHVFDAVHLRPRHTLVNTDKLTDEKAALNAVAVVRNDSEATQQFDVKVEILDPNGKQVAADSAHLTLDKSAELATEFHPTIASPLPWSADSPQLYTYVAKLVANGQVLDELRTPFGVRTVHVSPETGLEINGEKVLLYGGCLHHDNGPLGAAAFDRAEVRKVELMKAAGFNAVRTSHNPPSVAFLDACDRLGIYVIDEAFDGWAQKKTAHDYSRVFDDQWQNDIDAMVLRDRRHPSVVMWSIGNEVYERGSESGRVLAQKLSDRIRYWDHSRPITAGVNGLGEGKDWPKLDPIFAPLTVSGYNYELHRHADDHARVPSRVIFASESYQSETFANWAIMVDNPYVIGDFVWTALDYLGEADIGRVFPPDVPARGHWEIDNNFPWHGAYCGDIDLTGWRKPVSHYRQIVWDRGEKLYVCVHTPSPSGKPWNLSRWSMPPALPSWTWPGQEGKPLQVDVYSRFNAVRLYHNDKLVGEQATGRDEEFKATFTVPYEPGTLKAVSVDNGAEATAVELVTAAPPAKLRLTPDRAKIAADGQDLSFVTVEVVDAAGHVNPLDSSAVKYEISGPGTIAGIGSGDLSSEHSYQANPRTSYQGRSLVVIRAGESVGKITLTANADGLEPATAEIVATSGL